MEPAPQFENDCSKQCKETDSCNHVSVNKALKNYLAEHESFSVLVLRESQSVNAQGDKPLLPLEQKLGQMVEPRINFKVVVSSITEVHQVVQAGW